MALGFYPSTQLKYVRYLVTDICNRFRRSSKKSQERNWFLRDDGAPISSCDCIYGIEDSSLVFFFFFNSLLVYLFPKRETEKDTLNRFSHYDPSPQIFSAPQDHEGTSMFLSAWKLKPDLLHGFQHCRGLCYYCATALGQTVSLY